jgi:hypothetical protein
MPRGNFNRLSLMNSQKATGIFDLLLKEILRPLLSSQGRSITKVQKYISKIKICIA